MQFCTVIKFYYRVTGGVTTEKGTEEEDKEQRHLPLLVVQLPQGTALLLSSRLHSAVKRCSSEAESISLSEVLLISLQRSDLVKGLARRN